MSSIHGQESVGAGCWAVMAPAEEREEQERFVLIREPRPACCPRTRVEGSATRSGSGARRGLLGMVTMILTTLNERRREMAILRSERGLAPYWGCS
jgi:hypothetical protein